MRTAREFALSLPFFVPQLTPIRCRSVLRLPHEAPFPDSGTTQGIMRPVCGWLVWRGAIPAPPHQGLTLTTHSQRTTSTGRVVWVRTFIVSLPRSMAETPRRPCEAMTIKSHRLASAISMMIS
jgi:hypothetical protein